MSAVLLYLLLYTVLVTGTFAVVGLVTRTGDGATDLAVFRGLGRQRPALALALTVLLLAQAGVPLTAGFVAKFGVIQAAVDVKSYPLAVIAMLTAVIAAFLYLRIMVSVWIADPEPADDALERVRTPWTAVVGIALSVGFTLAIGFAPGWLIDLGQPSRQSRIGVLVAVGRDVACPRTLTDPSGTKLAHVRACRNPCYACRIEVVVRGFAASSARRRCPRGATGHRPATHRARSRTPR